MFENQRNRIKWKSKDNKIIFVKIGKQKKVDTDLIIFKCRF